MTTTLSQKDSEIFPAQYTYPPFYTRQLNSTAWTYQRTIWAGFILKYCRSKKIYRLNVAEALDSELFGNREIGRRLKYPDAIEILDYMCTQGNIEWEKPDASSNNSNIPGVAGGIAGKTNAIVWWRKPEEWANVIYEWIDSTGQKNTVLTLYEISEGDLTVSQEFYGMDPYCVRKSLEVLTKRGVAQIFSINDEFGIKFF